MLHVLLCEWNGCRHTKIFEWRGFACTRSELAQEVAIHHRVDPIAVVDCRVTNNYVEATQLTNDWVNYNMPGDRDHVRSSS